MKLETYHNKLKTKMDKYAHLVYKVTRSFPREELFGIKWYASLLMYKKL